MKQIKYYIASIIVIVCAVVFTAHTNKVEANPLATRPSAQTSIATTSLRTLSPGTGTTTLAYNAFASGLTRLSTGALLQIQYTASSSASSLRFRIEYSTDNVDFYPIAYQGTSNATTTSLADDYTEYNWRPATTTPYGGDFGGTGSTSPSGSAGVGRFMQSMVIATPSQYMRVIFYAPPGSGNGQIWAKLSPVGETP